MLRTLLPKSSPITRFEAKWTDTDLAIMELNPKSHYKLTCPLSIKEYNKICRLKTTKEICDSLSINSGKCLSMSTPGIDPSDVSLKLTTGYGEDACHAASVGGPLAEALRSSTTSSTSSPTSVLLQLPPSSACETSFIST